MNKKLIILTIGCLIVGFAAGVITTRMATKKRMHQMMDIKQPPKFLERMKVELKLTVAQTSQFDTIVNNHMVKVRAMRKVERQKMKTTFDSLFMNVEPILDAKQKVNLKKIREKIQQRRMKNNGDQCEGQRERRHRKNKSNA